MREACTKYQEDRVYDSTGACTVCGASAVSHTARSWWTTRKVDDLEGEPISAWKQLSTAQVDNLLRSGNIVEFVNDEAMAAYMKETRTFA